MDCVGVGVVLYSGCGKGAGDGSWVCLSRPSALSLDVSISLMPRGPCKDMVVGVGRLLKQSYDLMDGQGFQIRTD